MSTPTPRQDSAGQGSGPHKYAPPSAAHAATRGAGGPPPPPPGAGPYPSAPPSGYPQGGYEPAPAAYGPPPATGKPSAHWPLSIIAIICSLIFGAIGIYFSSEVGNRWNRGDVEGARKASRTALILDIIGIVVGVVAIIAYASSGSSGY